MTNGLGQMPAPRSKGLRVEMAFRPMDAGKWTWYASPMNTTEHAKRQAATRGIDCADVVSIALERIGTQRASSWAVLVGYADGWAGASNGNVVWAVVRGDTLATVMFRRDDQPSTPAAFDTERVIA